MSALVSQNGVDCNTKFHSEEPECKDYSGNFSVCIMRLHMVHLRRIQSFGKFVWNMFDFSSAILHDRRRSESKKL